MPYMPRNDFVTFMLEQFGRPPRNSAVQCDCERAGRRVAPAGAEPGQPSPRAGRRSPTRPAAWHSSMQRDRRRRSSGSRSCSWHARRRLPDDGRAGRLPGVPGGGRRRPRRACRAVLWSLLNTREFVLQH